jgi:4-hydroxymandelate oxidase
MTRPEPLNLFEYEALAREHLPQAAYDYFASGAGDEITLRENRAAFDRLRLLPRILVDVSERDMSTTALGQPVSMPVLVAPTAFQRLATPDGELATARAAAQAGTLMVLSGLSNTPLEEAARATDGPKWSQLYVYRDRGLTRSLVQRAEAAGYAAICVTVDAPLLGRRERDVRNRFALPEGLVIANVMDALGKEMLATTEPGSSLAAYFARLLDQSVTWKDIAWLRSITRLPVVLKGIHHPDDARLAVEHGVDGVIVSNHGARQLDTVPAAVDMLPAVADAVEGRMEIYMDGGVRRGTDVVKALALGARAVLVGRPVLWGLAAEGEEGVVKVLTLLRAEVDLAMALCGVRRLSEIGPGVIWRSPHT